MNPRINLDTLLADHKTFAGYVPAWLLGRMLLVRDFAKVSEAFYSDGVDRTLLGQVIRVGVERRYNRDLYSLPANCLPFLVVSGSGYVCMFVGRDFAYAGDSDPQGSILILDRFRKADLIEALHYLRLVGMGVQEADLSPKAFPMCALAGAARPTSFLGHMFYPAPGAFYRLTRHRGDIVIDFYGFSPGHFAILNSGFATQPIFHTFDEPPLSIPDAVIIVRRNRSDEFVDVLTQIIFPSFVSGSHALAWCSSQAPFEPKHNSYSLITTLHPVSDRVAFVHLLFPYSVGNSSLVLYLWVRILLVVDDQPFGWHVLRPDQISIPITNPTGGNFVCPPFIPDGNHLRVRTFVAVTNSSFRWIWMVPTTFWLEEQPTFVAPSYLGVSIWAPNIRKTRPSRRMIRLQHVPALFHEFKDRSPSLAISITKSPTSLEPRPIDELLKDAQSLGTAGYEVLV